MPGPALVDDAAIFPPGDAPSTRRPRPTAPRSADEGAELVGTFVVRDTDLPLVRGFAAPLSVVVTGGAGQVAGPAGLVRTSSGSTRRPRDRAARPRRPRRQRPPGRRGRSTRSGTRRRAGLRRAAGRPTPTGWLAAADEVAAEAELPAEVPHRRARGRGFPAATTLAALDRRRARPRDAVQVHRRAAPRRPPHRRRRLRAPRLPQRAGRDPAGLRRRRRRRGGRDARERDGAPLEAARDVSPGAGAGSPRSAPARSTSRWADLRALGLVSMARPRASGSTTCPTASSRSTATPAGSASASRTACSTSPPPPGAPSSRALAERASWRSGPRCGGRPAPRCARCSRAAHHRPAGRRRAAPAVRGRRLRRLLRLRAPRHQRRADLPPRRRALLPNWKHLPVGYHGRAGTVVPSARRWSGPAGSAGPDAAAPTFGPSRRLDIEAELGFVVGAPLRLGTPVPHAGFADHVFGVVGLNDWSARDIQAWEYVPLGPFLGKSFATSISPLGHAAGGAGRRVVRPARPGPTAAALPRPRPRPRARHRRRGRAQRRGGQPAAVRLDVLGPRPRCSPT